ncbi:hypothetical protein KDH_77680 [Dictyobacter sp. S3.2.2.5]|uniref:histidine kinase n=1 Tax=Dictyobacter halimunensis TaxID=3026934 RepID=A0ABQ6G352_9CHLR|nr:hypothetical protein KDH_77680 [Dictyobacter sp. S3.2.2.5]
MNTSESQDHNSQPDLLLTTLERLLAIDAIQIEPALHQGAQLIGEALSVDKVDVFFYDSTTHSLVALGSNESPISRLQRSLGLDRLPIVNQGRAVEAFVTGKTIATGNLDQDEKELLGMRLPEPNGMGLLSQIATRIEIQGEPRGVLVADSIQREYFNEQDVRFMEAAARWIGMVMHRAEMAEQQTRDALQQGRRLAAEELLTIMAHDLRNYLTPLKARLDLLYRRARREGRAEDITDTQLASATLSRLNRLIGNLLDVARLDQGLFALQLQPLNFMDLLNDTTPSFSSTGKPIQVEGLEEVVLTGDPDRLRQTLENLLANAATHAPDHTPILVRVGMEQRGSGPWMICSIHNQGTPIPTDMIAHLFQPFVTGNRSRGLGIGLYLARSIVEAHKGELTVSSEGSIGTEFTLALPINNE